MNFVGARLETLRGFHGLTLAELGDRVSVSPGLLSMLEREQRQPSDRMAATLAEALSVTVGFFHQPLLDVWTEEQCSFRHRRSAQERVKRKARAHGTMISVLLDWLAERCQFPPDNVPRLSAATFEDVEVAAEFCREHWGLGLDTPIVHMGRVLEHAGVVIVQHLSHSEKIDAFSRPGTPSVVVLGTAKRSTSRWVFDLAHELMHLVLHVGRPTGDRETEAQAEYGGGAFLLPRRAFAREFGSPPTASTAAFWEHVFSLKRRWRVSGQAIVRRAYNLGLIGEVTYRQAYKYASARGWKGGRVPEPYEPDFKGPELLPAALDAIESGTGVTVQQLCDELSITPEIFYGVTGIQPKRSEVLGKLVRPRLLDFSSRS
jgi:Zn-dependent peptidase ImmA (M78 family)/transcriptional regulator with XRE-family HTH domain